MRQLPDHGPDRKARGAVDLKKKAREVFRDCVVPAVAEAQSTDALYLDPEMHGSWKAKPPTSAQSSRNFEMYEGGQRPRIHLEHRKRKGKPRFAPELHRTKPADVATGGRDAPRQFVARRPKPSIWAAASPNKPMYSQHLGRSPRPGALPTAVPVQTDGAARARGGGAEEIRAPSPVTTATPQSNMDFRTKFRGRAVS
jgi:hypothetical protein